MHRVLQQKSFVSRAPLFVSALGLILSLVACGGGGGSGGGQDPDPVAVDLPVAYVKRPLPVDVLDSDDDDDVTELVYDDVLEPWTFNPGAALYIRDRAAPGARETNITDRAWPAGAQYDVKDVDVSSDGRQLVFAMRAPHDPALDDDEQAKWDIWFYDLDTDELFPLLSTAEAQVGHDVAPAFLPGDTHVVFSSDRQSKSREIRLFDGKSGFAAIHEGNGNGDPEYAFSLHTVEISTARVEQITFNQSHDLQPSMLDDGRIIFLRWDNFGGQGNTLSLYTANPDGSNVQFYYGLHSQNTATAGSVGVFSRPREMPDGRILVNLRPRVDERYGGDIVFIDGNNYTEIDRGTYQNSGAIGPGQVSASVLEVATYDVDDLIDPEDLDDPGRRISPHGRFNSAFPLEDGTGRLLVTWSQCLLIDPDDPDQLNPTLFLPCTDDNLASDPSTTVLPHEAPPRYGVWSYNPGAGTQLPIFQAQQGMMFTEIVAMTNRTIPVVIPSAEMSGDADLIAAGVGVVHIRSVYDFDGVDTSAAGITATSNPNNPAYATRPARFLRIIKAVGQPDDDELDINNGSFGFANPSMMKDILGYVPIEPDGSVKFQVPGNLAFTLSITDASGRRLPAAQSPQHRIWLQVRPGETLECNGCHTAASEQPHGRFDAEPPSANSGAPTTAQFPNTQPTLQAEMGETMAETYARIEGIRTPSVDLVYSDPWTLAATPEVINVSYNDLLTPAPVAPTCLDNWDALCRVTINYPDHIQPIWEFSRVDGAMNDITCTNCHNKQDPLNANATQVPAGQLELTADLGNNALNINTDGNGLRSISYQDLLRADAQLELVGGVLRRRQVEVSPEIVDPDTGDITPAVFRDSICRPAMTPNSARNSSGVKTSNTDCEIFSAADFFTWFAAGDPDHGGYLNDAELKLISEWLDIGAQYYNNPFDAPLN